MRPLLHVGYAKAGSTWLQRHVFDNADVGFVLADRREAVDDICRPHPLEFDAQRLEEKSARWIEEAAARGLVPVVSEESFVGHPHSGGHNSKENADRLRAVFPGAGSSW